MTSINNNLMAKTASRSLQANYLRLSDSVQRLSSGLRVNSAADDAAGLAIRELMRADVAALNQGMRNANDAISLLQTADGALAVIDEKLIRMKELAEQAATGTYNSDQRLMIASEFQAMGDEIDRIARATDFNGIKLLDGSLSGAHDGKGLQAKGSLKIHFGTENDSAEDYYYVRIDNCTTRGLGLHDPVSGAGTATVSPGAAWLLQDAVIDWDANTIVVDVKSRTSGPDNRNTPGIQNYDRHEASPQAVSNMPGFDYYTLPVGLINITATSSAGGEKATHKPHINLFTRDGTQITGVNPTQDWTLYETKVTTSPTGLIWWSMGNDYNGQGEAAAAALMTRLSESGVLEEGAVYNGAHVIYEKNDTVTVGGATITILEGMNEKAHDKEVIFIDQITSDLVFLIGGHDTPGAYNMCNVYDLQITAEMTPELKARLLGGEAQIEGETRLIDIKTQEKAQKALTRLSDAIVSKDKVRGHLGALQNRFENTVSNLSIQAENLLASESRISDVDVAAEMTNFVKNQVLTQAATAMLGQANNYPQILAGLLGA